MMHNVVNEKLSPAAPEPSSAAAHKIEIAQQAIDISLRRRGRIQPFPTIEASKTALLVVDMQTGFVAPGGVAEIPVARKIVPQHQSPGRRLAPGGRHGRLDHLHLRSRRRARLDDLLQLHHHRRGCRSVPPGVRRGASPSTALWHELDRRPADPVISKNRLTPFADPARKLETLLRASGIDMVLVTGTVTNVCCECTARDAAMRNFKTIMIADANASRNDAEHNATLSIFLQAFGG